MRIEKFLKNAGASFEKHRHAKAFTAQELAAEEHISGHKVAKSVAITADNRRLLCVLPASCKVDLNRLAEMLDASECHIADEAELEQLFPDVKVGAEPPFGNLYGLPTVVDERLTHCEMITFSAGTYRKSIRMPYREYARLAEPQVLDFAMPSA
ncbi:MAG: aminoacyl-tRNA deacylase [Planctomycetota bacterium]|jgi:Ala-tRNA(Pro) deacylase